MNGDIVSENGLPLDEEIQKMEIQKQHLQFQLEMLARRIESMKKDGVIPVRTNLNHKKQYHGTLPYS